jgi:hypothetical protein
MAVVPVSWTNKAHGADNKWLACSGGASVRPFADGIGLIRVDHACFDLYA